MTTPGPAFGGSFDESLAALLGSSQGNSGRPGPFRRRCDSGMPTPHRGALGSTVRQQEIKMAKPKTGEDFELVEETIGQPAEPLDTDDNDETYADASGDSEDETEEENEAPDTWHKGED